MLRLGDNDGTVFYCNHSFKRSDFDIKKECQFCGIEINTSLANNYLPNSGKIDVKVGIYSKEYILCRKCGTEILALLEKKKRGL